MSHPRRIVPWLMAGALATGVGVAAAQPAAAATGCRVDYTVTNQWQARLRRRREGHQPGRRGDRLDAELVVRGRADRDAGVERRRRRRAARRSPRRTWRTTAPSRPAARRPSGSTAPGPAANPVPTSFTLNGAACTGGTTTPTQTPTHTPTSTPTSLPRALPRPPGRRRQVEKLDRGLISVRSGSGNLVQWRLLGTEPASTGVQRLPRRYQDRRPDHRIDQLPGRGRRGERHLHGPRRGRRHGAGRVGRLADVRQRLPRRADPEAVGATTWPTTAASATSTATASSRSCSSGTRRTPRTTRSPAYTGNVTSTRTSSTGARLWRIDLGPQHPRRRALHAVPGLRLRRRRQGRGRHEDRGRHAVGHRSGDRRRSADYRNSSGYVLSGPEFLTVFYGQTGAVLATTELRPAARHGVQLGRLLRQPRRPLPRRHRLPGRAAPVDHHGPRLLHAIRHRGVGLAERPAHPSGGRSTATTPGNSTYAGQGNHAAHHRRHRRRRQAGDRLRRDGRRRQRQAPLEHRTRATATPPHLGDLIPSRPGLEVLQGRRGRDQARRLDGRRQDRHDPVDHAGHGCDNGRGVSDDIYAGSPGAESWSSSDSQLRNTAGTEHRPQARLDELPGLVGRRPVARAARRDPHRQVRHRRRHPAADRRGRALEQRHQVDARALRATCSATGAKR